MSPAFPCVAPSIDETLFDLLPGYQTSLYFNILELASGVVPVSQVNVDESSYKDGQGDSFEHHAKQAMLNSAGMPVGVQISGNQDEKVLRVMREL